tara:strand:- start:391 stop:696 length:306 start_codon:yes stop_codon:yes gene_type:complete
MNLKKYEGHTGPWKPHTIQPLYGNMVLFGFNEQDALLASEAPLLLAGIKVLQHKLMLAESALGEIRAYHESGQGNLGEIIEHYQKNELVKMPNIFDETKED